MGVVYIHSNLADDKVYVGQTWDRHQRELDHRNSSSKYPFAKAIQAHGWNSFLHYYSEEMPSQGDLDNLERAWIILLMATNAKHGYNRRFGGARGKHTEETKQLLRIARARQGPPSEEGRRKISERHKGHKYCLGRHASEETKRKMSLASRGKKHSGEWIRNQMAAVQRTKLANKGKPPSEAQKLAWAKFGERMRGNKFGVGRHPSPEARLKMSIARKGKKQDPEFVKRRIAASVKVRWGNSL